MTLSRREFLTAGTAFGAGAVLLAACGTSSTTGAGSTTTLGSTPSGHRSVAQSVAELTAYLSTKGYTQAPAASLTTGNPYNGGLMYDVDDTLVSDRTYVVQPAARVEDVAKQHIPGTLPIFSMLVLDTTTTALAHQATDTIMQLLTKAAGLKAANLRVSTTDHSSEFFPQLASYGIGTAQIRLRPWTDAVAAGSGSGYFAPAGYPGAPAFPSFSIEHVQSDGTELEVAEIVYGTGGPKVTAGVGVDRVAMARNDKTTTWADSVSGFTNAVEGAVQKTGAALPPGYYAILGKAQPATTGA